MNFGPDMTIIDCMSQGSGQTGDFPLFGCLDTYADLGVDDDCFDSEPVDSDIDVEVKS